MSDKKSRTSAKRLKADVGMLLFLAGMALASTGALPMVVAGALLAPTGILLVIAGGKPGLLFHLPGDNIIRLGELSFPLTSALLLSASLGLLMWCFRWLSQILFSAGVP